MINKGKKSCDAGFRPAIKGLALILAAAAAALVMAAGTALAGEKKETVNPSESGETYLGDIVADAMRAAMGADIGLVNGGSIGFADLPEKLDEKSVSKIVPFSDDLVVAVKLDGGTLAQILEKSCQLLPRRSSSFLQVSGISFTCDVNKAPGRRVSDVQVGGKPIDPEKEYTVAATEFLASGGGGMTPFRSGEIVTEEGVPIGGIVLANARYDKKKIDTAAGRINIIEKEKQR